MSCYTAYEIQMNSGYREGIRKQLFAEDLLYFFLTEITAIKFWPYTVDYARSFVDNPFTSTMKSATWYILNDSKEDVFSYYITLIESDLLNLQEFEHFAFKYHKNCFGDGFEPIMFLNYCPRLAYLGILFLESGIKEAPLVAIRYIVNAMAGDLTCGGWDVLNSVATKYSLEYNTMNITAESYSSASSEDDINITEESYSSASSEDMNIAAERYSSESSEDDMNIIAERYSSASSVEDDMNIITDSDSSASSVDYDYDEDNDDDTSSAFADHSDLNSEDSNYFADSESSCSFKSDDFL